MTITHAGMDAIREQIRDLCNELVIPSAMVEDVAQRMEGRAEAGETLSVEIMARYTRSGLPEYVYLAEGHISG